MITANPSDTAIAYQIYANHKQLVAIKSKKPPKGNENNLMKNKAIRGSTTTKGKFSVESRKRLKETIYNWASTIYILKETTDFKKKHASVSKRIQFQFITLTLPSRQNHTDHEIKREFGRFLYDLSRIIGYNFNYVWRAETQQNGNIHFHLLTDHYFPIWLLMHHWNDTMHKMGYISNLGFINPITVNQKTVKSMKHVWTYLHKYCSKCSYSTRRGVEGRQWGSSDSVKDMIGKKHAQLTNNEFFDVINKSMQYECKISYVNEFVTIIYFNSHSLTDIVGKDFALSWLSAIKTNFDKINPILLQYKHINKWTTNDYNLMHSWKFNYTSASDDTDTTRHFEKYDEVHTMFKMNQKRMYHLK